MAVHSTNPSLKVENFFPPSAPIMFSMFHTNYSFAVSLSPVPSFNSFIQGILPWLFTLDVGRWEGVERGMRRLKNMKISKCFNGRGGWRIRKDAHLSLFCVPAVANTSIFTPGYARLSSKRS